MPFIKDVSFKRKKPEQYELFGLSYLAEAMRFELMNPCELPVFKTGAFNRSATPPKRSLDCTEEERIFQIRISRMRNGPQGATS